MEAPETEPASIAEALTAAINAHDGNGALAWLAENAVLHTPDREPAKHIGKDQIRAWLQHDADHNISVEVEAFQVTRQTVTGTARVANDPLRSTGVRRVVGALEIVVQSGKITSFTFTPERGS